jgi:hypothetical protein
MLCDSGATLLQIREQTRQLEIGDRGEKTFVFVELYSLSAISDIKE